MNPSIIAKLLTEDPDVSPLKNGMMNNIPDDAGDVLYGSPDSDKEYPDSDMKSVDGKTVKLIKFLAQAIAYPVYGPIVYLINKFVPTAMLVELIKTIRMYGDTIIGDMRLQRRLQKEIRKAAVKRFEIKNKKQIDDILAGHHDHELDDLRYGRGSVQGPKIKRALGLGESESQLQIASMISEDPDVMDASQMSAPMSTSDIERQAEAETGDDPEAEVKDDIRKQEEEERKEREERRRVLQPQIDQINKSIQDLETGLKTGIEATRNLGDLDNQISKIAQSVGGIEKQIY